MHDTIRKAMTMMMLALACPTVWGQTPLEKALSERDTAKALSLIKAGVDPNIETRYGSLLITYCRWNNDEDPMAYFLLGNGAKPDTLRSATGRTALHVAASYYACEKLCGALLDAGADINAKTLSGETPLMLAALSAKLRLVKYLVARGADPRVKDNKGKTAYDYALRADALDDLPVAKKKLEESCGFNKQETVAYCKKLCE